MGINIKWKEVYQNWGIWKLFVRQTTGPNVWRNRGTRRLNCAQI